MKQILFGLLLLAACSTMYSCDQEPEIIIEKEIITVHDTLYLLDTIIETIFQSTPDTATTYILLRHAETTGAGSNPALSAAGMARAEELKGMLQSLTVSAVYATNFLRTQHTAQPLATDQGLTVQPYDAFSPDPLIDQTLEAYPMGVVVIVGHSNTTPDFLNAMTGTSMYQDIPESEYDNLFIVHVTKRGRATVTHLKY